MFGGYGLYQDEFFFGILIQGRLYFKTNDQTRMAYAERGMKAFVYEKTRRIMTMTYFEVPPDVLENSETLVTWARLAVAVAASTPRKVRKTSALKRAAR
jgi:DNA transformation protein